MGGRANTNVPHSSSIPPLSDALPGVSVPADAIVLTKTATVAADE